MNQKEQKGCFLVIITLLRFIIVTPLYYIFMYFVLEHIQATSFIWTIFWIYAPFSVMFAVLSEIASMLLKRDVTKSE